MKLVFVIFIFVSFCGTVSAEEANKITDMKGQNHKVWTNKNGVQRIYPIYLAAKVALQKAANNQEAAVASEAEKKVQLGYEYGDQVSATQEN